MGMTGSDGGSRKPGTACGCDFKLSEWLEGKETSRSGGKQNFVEDTRSRSHVLKRRSVENCVCTMDFNVVNALWKEEVSLSRMVLLFVV